MAIRILPDKPATTQSVRPDIAFELRTGKKGFSGGLPTWRFLAANPTDAAAFAEYYGGTVTSEGSRDYPEDVITGADEVLVVMDGSKAVYDHLILWGAGGQPPIHDCDGELSNLQHNKGEPCGCGGDWEVIKEKINRQDPAQAKPSIEFTFTLAHDEEMGTGKLVAGGVVLAEDVPSIKNALDAVDGPALVALRKEEIKSNNRPNGFVVTRVEVKGSYNDAVADEPGY